MEHQWPEEPASPRQGSEPDLTLLLEIGKPLSLLGYVLFLWSVVLPH